MRFIRINEGEGSELSFDFGEDQDIPYHHFYQRENPCPDLFDKSTNNDDLSDDAYNNLLPGPSFLDIDDDYVILAPNRNEDASKFYFNKINELPSVKKTPGYRELEICARQALNHGIRYIWAESCCVDKRNDHDVEFVTNNRFDICRKAQFFCVFLRDYLLPDPVQKHDELTPHKDVFDRNSQYEGSYLHSAQSAVRSTNVNVDVAPHPPNMEEFRRSEWFSSVWMLSELIAPRVVKFFDMDGRYIGDKRSLRHVICNITKLPLSALHPFCHMESFSFQERWRWIESLEAPREEGDAHYLLGILGETITFRDGDEKSTMRWLKQSYGIQRTVHGRPTNIGLVQQKRLTSCIEAAPVITDEIASSVNQKIQDSVSKRIIIFNKDTGVTSALSHTIIAVQRYSGRTANERWGSVSTFYLSADSSDQQATCADVLLGLLANLVQNVKTLQLRLPELYDGGRDNVSLDRSEIIKTLLILTLRTLRYLSYRTVIVTDLSAIPSGTRLGIEKYLMELSEEDDVKWITTTKLVEQGDHGLDLWECTEQTPDYTNPDISQWTTITINGRFEGVVKDQKNTTTPARIDNLTRAFHTSLGYSLSPNFLPDNSEHSHIAVKRGLEVFYVKVEAELHGEDISGLWEAIADCDARSVIDGHSKKS